MPPPQDDKAKGNSAFKAGLMDDAVKYYTRAIQKDKKDFVCYANRSAAYLKMGYPEEALEDADRCVRLKPKYAKGHARKAMAFHALKLYGEEVAAYKAGLHYCPDDPQLQQGLQGAKRARTSNSKASQAARKTEATMKAATSRGRKANRAANLSQFVKETKKNLELQMAAIQAQLDMINELSKMSIEEKVDLLFSLMDKDGGGTIDAKELADGLRKQDNMSFSSSIERAIEMIAMYDSDGDAELDREEFEHFLERMVTELDTQFDEMCEFLVYQILFSEDDSDEDVDMKQVNEEVKERGELLDSLSDPRMKTLFKLFDKDGSGHVTFTDVAVGLYHLTQDMEESAKATTNLLLMLDKDDKRVLGYHQFAKLILAIAATTSSTFDEVADDLTLALTSAKVEVDEETLQILTIADADYAKVREKNKFLKKNTKGMDPFSYERTVRLFDLWDSDGSGTLDFEELFSGLRRYQQATSGQTNEADVEKAARQLMEGDVDGDQELDREEFAYAMVRYAETSGTSLHDLIDFICVVTGLG